MSQEELQTMIMHNFCFSFFCGGGGGAEGGGG